MYFFYKAQDTCFIKVNLVNNQYRQKNTFLGYWFCTRMCMDKWTIFITNLFSVPLNFLFLSPILCYLHTTTNINSSPPGLLTSSLRKALSAIHATTVSWSCIEASSFRMFLSPVLHCTAIAPWLTAYIQSSGDKICVK